MAKPKFLIVGDLKIFCEGIEALLQVLEYTDIETAENDEEAFQKLKAGAYNLVIVDEEISGVGGIDLVEEIKRFNITRVLLVIPDNEEKVNEVIASDNLCYIKKPATKADLKRVTDKIFKNKIF